MPKRNQRDPSPGDARKPFSDRGGPAGRHAETHDVRREELTNPKGPEPDREAEFAEDIAPSSPTREFSRHPFETEPAVEDKDLYERLPMLERDELARLPVLETGTRLGPGRGPFKALGGQEAGPRNRYVAKDDVDYELWNRLVGQHREPEVERPAREAGS